MKQVKILASNPLEMLKTTRGLQWAGPFNIMRRRVLVRNWWKHRYYTNNTGLEAPFAGSIVLYIPKTTLLVVSWITVAAGAPDLKG